MVDEHVTSMPSSTADDLVVAVAVDDRERLAAGACKQARKPVVARDQRSFELPQTISEISAPHGVSVLSHGARRLALASLFEMECAYAVLAKPT
jgi:hypothetical protein